ncbi:g2872 [Coccomyxa viridis]|uniref:protein-tyrosine-phosphatase n=1 Tax=Coccomyxa viridis TaxID=1274662 RepID=A0ABP1FNR2_9CHLO
MRVWNEMRASEQVPPQECSVDSIDRCMAIQKLISVRNFAHQDSDPCWVLEGLYLGSIGSARNLEGLKKRGITHVLNASPIVPRFHKRHFSYMTIQVYDDVDEDIARFFHQAACFIARGRRKGGVLVHCYAGQSRSVALVLAYLCSALRMQLPDAYKLVLSARPSARPNSGFMRQLESFVDNFQTATKESSDDD